MKKVASVVGTIFITIVVVSALVFLSACKQAAPKLSPEASPPPPTVIKIKVTDFYPATSAAAQAYTWWGTEIEKRTDGRVKFEYYFSASLVGVTEMLSAISKGTIEAGQYLTAYTDKAPVASIADLPFMNSQNLKGEVLAAQEWFTTSAAVLGELKQNTVKWMFPQVYGEQYIWSNKPIESLKDLKGLKLRHFGSYLELYKIVGAEVVQLTGPEIYGALERKLVDASSSTLTYAVGNKLHEVTKYVMASSQGDMFGPAAVMNQAFWNSLPGDIQQIIEEVNRKMPDKVLEINERVKKAELDIVKNAGLVFTTLSKDDLAVLRETARVKVWEPHVERTEQTSGLPAKKALEEYLNLLKKYAAIHG